MNSNKLPVHHRVDLKNQLFLLIVMPGLTLVLIMLTSAWFLQSENLHRQFVERGHTLASHYQQEALSYLGTDEGLRQLSNRLINEPGVRAVHVYRLDKQNRIQSVEYAGPRMRPKRADKGLGEALAATHRFRVPLDDELSPTLFLEIELDRETLQLHSYQSLLLLLLVGLISVLLLILFAHFAANRFAEPIRSIAYAISRIREGHLSTRVSSRIPSGELYGLIAGVNSMAASLQEAHEELQHSVDQATEDLRATLETIEIQNIELDFARKEAEQASRIKSQFLANISHEIRTPLNSIIGFSNLLLRSTLSSKQQEQMQIILGSSENLLSIINDILDVSKIEAGKLNLDIEETDIRAILTTVTELLAPMAREKGLQQELLIDEDVPHIIYSDALRIQQILTNLMNNAIKFSDHGKLLVRVSMLASTSNDGLIRIAVSDQGIGLSEKAKEKLFDAFHQSDTSNIRRFQGTGLGLTISRHLVELLGGEIGVESTLGEGSTFWFTLPCIHTNYGLTRRLNHDGIREANNKTDLENTFAIPKVLAVDDNEANLKLLCAFLDDLGIDHDACHSGREALERNKLENYDLIFMDIQMPDMDGIKATELIREYDKRFNRHKAIIALTAHALEEERKKLIDIGFNDCLTKPVDVQLLQESIEHWTGYTPELVQQIGTETQAQAATSQIIDAREGLQLAGNKADLAEEMLTMLVTGLEAELEAMQQYINDDNMESLLDKLHYLHGACRYCGVPALRHAAMTMENALKKKQYEDIPALFAILQQNSEALTRHYQQAQKPVHA